MKIVMTKSKNNESHLRNNKNNQTQTSTDHIWGTHQNNEISMGCIWETLITHNKNKHVRIW